MEWDAKCFLKVARNTWDASGHKKNSPASFLYGEFERHSSSPTARAFQHYLTLVLLFCFFLTTTSRSSSLPWKHLIIPSCTARFRRRSVCFAFQEPPNGSDSLVEIFLEIRFTFNVGQIGVGFFHHFFTPTSWKVLRSFSLPWILDLNDFCHFFIRFKLDYRTNKCAFISFNVSV